MARSPAGPVSRATAALLQGPPRAYTHASRFQRLLPWRTRLLIVAGAAIVGWFAGGNRLFEQVGGALQYSGLIIVSLAVSFWRYFFALNLILALAWLFWPAAPPRTHPRRAWVQAALTFLNRQWGHFQALTAWSVLAVVSRDSVAWQLPAVIAVLLLGEPLVNGLTAWLHRRHGEARGAGLAWRRRPVIYALSYLAIGLIALLAWKQAAKLLPGLLAVGLADFVRVIRHRRWSRHMGVAPWWRRARPVTTAEPGTPAATTPGPNLHDDHHALQMRWARRSDFLLGPVLVAVGMVLLVVVNSVLVRQYLRAHAEPPQNTPRDYRGSAAPNAPRPDVALFVVADNQFHELRGHRFNGQLALAEALVPVAARPVELDLLSAAPLWHFGTLYQALAAARGGRLPWAHLGDMADLSCQEELQRTTTLLEGRFGLAAFAGVAPGNHDKAFTGNFFWNPFWDGACGSPRMEKADSDRLLRATWARARDASPDPERPALARLGIMYPLPDPPFSRRGTALLTVAPLGILARPDQGAGTSQGVLGIFLDTADGLAFDFGIAGLNGTFSSRQAEAATRVLNDARDAATATLGPAYADPLLLVFLHHPLAQMVWRSEARLRRWLAEREPRGPRILGIVSAHTHKAQSRAHCIGGRIIPELVVGSTLDPPQEAALLTAGPAPDGVPSLRVRTLPAVSRRIPGFADDDPGHPTPASCRALLDGLQGHPACAPLFAGDGDGPARPCAEIEQTLGVWARLGKALRTSDPCDHDEIVAEQRSRAHTIWTCLCRDHQCTPSEATLDLDDRAHAAQLLAELAKGSGREEELTCLAWAAGIVQRYKSGGMSFADALRCGFDDHNTPAGHDFITRLETSPPCE